MAYPAGVNDPIEQPVPFSHKHHVGDDGIRCRYCHSSVEESAFAGMPSIATCMSCHSRLYTDQGALAPVVAAFSGGAPLRWKRLNKLPDFVYFNHSIHISKGVGCESCHGEIDTMPLTARTAPLTMQWCLECHRDPGKYLRPSDRVFDLHWKSADQKALGPRLLKTYPHRYSAPRGLLRMSSLTESEAFDIGAARARLSARSGPALWRSLEELADSESFRRWLRQEQPLLAQALGLDRREFLRTLGAAPRSRGRDGVQSSTAGRDRSLRSCPQWASRRPAALLRDRVDAKRLRTRRTRRESHGAPQQDRGKSASPREPGSDRHLRTGGDSATVGPGPLANDPARRRRFDLGAILQPRLPLGSRKRVGPEALAYAYLAAQ